jgi:ABC-type antimicrobial peptide transport system permease subunit
MPANKKYLSSGGQQFLKITAGIFGGFIVTILFHNAIAVLLKDKGWLIITSAYSSFIVWVFMIVFAFMAKSGWKIWGIYLSITLLFSVIVYIYK